MTTDGQTALLGALGRLDERVKALGGDGPAGLTVEGGVARLLLSGLPVTYDDVKPAVQWRTSAAMDAIANGTDEPSAVISGLMLESLIVGFYLASEVGE